MILMKRCNNKAYKHCFVSRFKCIHFVGKSFSLSSSLFTRKFVAIWKPFSETLTAEKPRSTAAFLPVQQLIDNTILNWCALFRFFHVSTQCLKITLNWHANFNFFAKIHFGNISMTRNIFNWNFAKKPEIELSAYLKNNIFSVGHSWYLCYVPICSHYYTCWHVKISLIYIKNSILTLTSTACRRESDRNE